jgi:hypothetical protein
MDVTTGEMIPDVMDYFKKMSPELMGKKKVMLQEVLP